MSQKLSRPKRWASTLWGWGTFPNHRGYVGVYDDDRIQISFLSKASELEVAGDGCWIRLSRQDARMLARRLNQCLDRTAKP